MYLLHIKNLKNNQKKSFVKINASKKVGRKDELFKFISKYGKTLQISILNRLQLQTLPLSPSTQGNEARGLLGTPRSSEETVFHQCFTCRV